MFQSLVAGVALQVALPAQPACGYMPASKHSVNTILRLRRFLVILMKIVFITGPSNKEFCFHRAERSVGLDLRHNREREIVAVAAFVAGLEVVSVHLHDRAVGQVAEGAADRVGTRVADDAVRRTLLLDSPGRPLRFTVAPLLIVTPLAITLSVFAFLPLGLEGVGVGRSRN